MSENKSGNRILILGAGSDMAGAMIRLLFQEWNGCTFYLLARNISALKELAAQGESSGHKVELHHYDLMEPARLHFPNTEYCITYTGWLPDNKEAFEKSMLLNFTGIEVFVNGLIEDSGQTLKHIIITGSVAGVRCRPANRAYGLAKMALHDYALRLQKKWVGKIAVTLVIPGYVRTKMIADMKTPGILTLTTEQIAKKYYRYLESKPKKVYSQFSWKLVSTTLRLLPEFIIKRLNF